MADLEFKLKTLTQIWTGGADGKPDKLHLTGIKGSIRWWYEALIRGLGYCACDPTDDSENYKRCELKLNEEKRKALKSEPDRFDKIIKSEMCPACYLFGCTGWSGKFNLRVTESDSNSPKKSSLTEKISFELHFIEKKEFEEAENTLLKMTLKLIVDYGAIGGRTVFKPSEDTWKNVYTYKQIGIHADYGLIARLTNKEGEDISNIPTSQILNNDNRIIIENYLGKFTTVNKENHSDWPDLNYFWFVNGIYINRETHNEIVKRDPNNPKNYLPNADADFHKWLGGKPGEKDKPAISKKIFSFYSTRRCWGYTKKDDIMFYRLMEELIGCNIKNIICGKDVLNDL